MSRIDSVDKEFIRRDESELKNALRAAGCNVFRGKTCACPFHEDKHPSASINAKDGVWLFYCHVCGWGGDVFDVRAKAAGGTPVEELKKLNGNGNGNGHHVMQPRKAASIKAVEALYPSLQDCYRYTNPSTKAVEMLVVRYLLPDGRKKFSQWRPCEGGGFEEKRPIGKLPLYNRARLADCLEPIIVEGEKCVHSLHSLGIIATTSPGGAANGAHADWSPLNGKIKVTFWPDNDAAGKKYMADVIGQIEQLPVPPLVFIIDPAAFDLPDGADCVDFIEHWTDGGDAEEAKRAIATVIETAIPTGATKELDELVEDTISGKRSAIDFHSRATSRLTQATLPGKVTIVCGDPESGKTFWVLEESWRWFLSGIGVALYELEDDRADHLLRVLAQMSGESRLTDAKWMRENPDASRALNKAHQQELDAFGRCISTCPDTQIKLGELNEWIETQAKNGKRIIIIDPITAAEAGKTPWIQDLEFLIRAKATVRRYGVSLILVTHPRIGVNLKPGLASISGGAAYPRFSHTVLWMVKHAVPKNFKVQTDIGFSHTSCNRTLRIAKARNARGGGSDIGFFFDPKSLCFVEQGIVIGEDDDSSDPD